MPAQESAVTAAFLEHCSPAVAARVRELLELQSGQLRRIEKHQDAIAALEKEHYALSAKHHYEERADRVKFTHGSIKLDTTGSKALRDAASYDDVDGGIPDFWLTVLENNPLTKRVVKNQDKAALKYLHDIYLEYPLGGGHAFTLGFSFDSENPFFENSVLTKTFTYERDDEDFTGNLVYGSTTGDEIRWKEGWSLTRLILQDQDGNDCPDEMFERPSFFRFFATLVKPTPTSLKAASEPSTDLGDARDDDAEHEVQGRGGESGDEDEDEEEEGDESGDDDHEDDNDTEEGGSDLDVNESSSEGQGSGSGYEPTEEAVYEQRLEAHFTIGEEIRDRIIPYAVHWFTGEAGQWEDDFDDGEMDDDEEEE